ncbi:hypothetical protein Ancab_010192 [Ancistrocladus abbreviatus]
MDEETRGQRHESSVLILLSPDCLGCEKMDSSLDDREPNGGWNWRGRGGREKCGREGRQIRKVMARVQGGRQGKSEDGFGQWSRGDYIYAVACFVLHSSIPLQLCSFSSAVGSGGNVGLSFFMFPQIRPRQSSSYGKFHVSAERTAFLSFLTQSTGRRSCKFKSAAHSPLKSNQNLLR